MEVTTLGHAGLRIDVASTSIVCDPWATPAFMASWYPFPRNDFLAWREICGVDFLYISHIHEDHLDSELLAEHVDPSTQVLLPTFDTNHLRAVLKRCNLQNFIELPNGKRVDLAPDLAVTCDTQSAPTDSPFGDSTLAIESAGSRLLNQNDARFVPAHWREGEPAEAHFVQFSGAIWFPHRYMMTDAEQIELGERKRRRQFERALRSIRLVRARSVFPFAGPPCFLDPENWSLNDFQDSSSNIFQDQRSCVASLMVENIHNAIVSMPGDRYDIVRGVGAVRSGRGQEDAQWVYAHKKEYLERYRASIGAIFPLADPLPDQTVGDLVRLVAVVIRDAMNAAPDLARRVGITVRFIVRSSGGTEASLFADFSNRVVTEGGQEVAAQTFEFSAHDVRFLLDQGVRNWTDNLLLSMRFRTQRSGPYNEALYAFLRSLDPVDAKWTQDWFAARDEKVRGDHDRVELGGVSLPRWCPHLGADLSIFGDLDGDVLTCHNHGWSWRVSTDASGEATLTRLP